MAEGQGRGEILHGIAIGSQERSGEQDGEKTLPGHAPVTTSSDQAPPPRSPSAVNPSTGEHHAPRSNRLPKTHLQVHEALGRHLDITHNMMENMHVKFHSFDKLKSGATRK